MDQTCFYGRLVRAGGSIVAYVAPPSVSGPFFDQFDPLFDDHTVFTLQLRPMRWAILFCFALRWRLAKFAKIRRCWRKVWHFAESWRQE